MRTRSLLLFATTALLISFTARAQKFRAGFTLGLDASTINGFNNNDHLHKVGVIAGAIINTSLTPNVIAQIEMNFIQKGSLQPPDSLGNGYKKVALSYIELPLILRRRLNFNVRKKPVLGFELEFGASVGRLVDVVSINSQNAAVPIDGIHKYDVSLLAGLNYVVSKNFYVSIRYSNSVIPVMDRSPARGYLIYYTWNRGNNQALQFSLKFVFGGVGQAKPNVEGSDQQ